MDDLSAFQARTDAIGAALQKKFGLKPAPFPQLVARARRGLPRHVWQRAQTLAEAHEKAANPRLGRTLDFEALQKAAALVDAHLKALDVADERRTRRLSLAAGLSFNMLVVFALLIAVLLWRDFL